MDEKKQLIDLLNSLLEAERAGVATINHLLDDSPRDQDELIVQYEQVRKDEAWSCAGLHEAIIREGGIPSKSVGSFVDKVKALNTLKEKLILLNKGQAWVARKIDEARTYGVKTETEAFLQEMKAKHVTNINSLDEFLDK